VSPLLGTTARAAGEPSPSGATEITVPAADTFTK
jgi:hypothetical protein